jgi:hypothetical protein
MSVVGELEKYKVDLVEVQERRWGWIYNNRQIHFSVVVNHHLETEFFTHNRIISAVKMGRICDRILYITLKGRWCDVIGTESLRS